MGVAEDSSQQQRRKAGQHLRVGLDQVRLAKFTSARGQSTKFQVNVHTKSLQSPPVGCLQLLDLSRHRALVGVTGRRSGEQAQLNPSLCQTLEIKYETDFVRTSAIQCHALAVRYQLVMLNGNEATEVALS